MLNLFQRFVMFLWILKTDKIEIAHIILALSIRQANGRSNIKPYDDAKRLAETIPFANKYIKEHN